jgi:SagB-type dehydrogenase family enzyme
MQISLHYKIGVKMKDDSANIRIMELREFMKTGSVDAVSDQQEGLPQPSLEKQSGGNKLISLTMDFEHVVKNNDYMALLNARTSRRKYSEDALTKEELAFLLWSTQGVKQVIGKKNKATLRTVPSAGARHPFETYLFINRVDGLEPGLYHYLALEHKLEFIGTVENQVDRLAAAYSGQTFFANAAVCFVWTVVPYRSEWRYHTVAQKYALVDVGHVCQNLYLASEAISCGTCAIGAYNQVLADQLLGLDSSPSFGNENEFVIYAASVGKL